MDFVMTTNYRPCTLLITVRSLKSCVLCLQVQDSRRPHTYLTDRTMEVFAGEVIPFQVQMPMAPLAAQVTLYDEAIGNRDARQETSFVIEKIGITGLPKFLHAIDLTHKLRVFVDFAQRFCFNAGILPTSDTEDVYYSRDSEKMYELHYLPVLLDPKTGMEHPTPARVDIDSKEFEVSKKKFIDMTVPERFCVMCHEYSHHHMNVDPTNELEADLNGLSIYLALGYSPIEAIETYTSIFETVPTNQNAFERLPAIERFIDGFYQEFYQHKHKAA